jgi:hypothetical protein
LSWRETVVEDKEEQTFQVLWTVYLVSSFRWVIKSLRSLFFLRPPKAILVPGMYFLGFSRYSNYVDLVYRGLKDKYATYQCILVPFDTLLLVGVGVGETLHLTGLAAEQTV